jgi:hypothetical protein
VSRAGDRLTEIANTLQKVHWDKKATTPASTWILFCTPELAIQGRVVKELQRIASLGELKRIVLDEFDVAADGTREAYLDIIPKYRQHIPKVKFTCLSATTCRSDISELLARLLTGKDEASAKLKPQIFSHDRPISESLAFSVERKISTKQVSFCF